MVMADRQNANFGSCFTQHLLHTRKNGIPRAVTKFGKCTLLFISESIGRYRFFAHFSHYSRVYFYRCQHHTQHWFVALKSLLVDT